MVSTAKIIRKDGLFLNNIQGQSILCTYPQALLLLLYLHNKIYYYTIGVEKWTSRQNN